jgi:hypothetical protein
MGLISAKLRLWLYQLCQSRSGQCLNASSPLPPGEGPGVRETRPK